jgi:hypothetical protein
MDDHGSDAHGTEDGDERTTAPQSDYTGRQVGIGLVVMLLGVAVSLALPLVLVPF